MAYNLMKFEQTNLSTGVQTFTSDFAPDVRFHIDTKNVTTGIQQGVGPRFGMAPIPGQQDTTSEGVNFPASLRLSEESSGSAYVSRRFCYGVYRVFSGSKTTWVNPNSFCWIIGRGSGLADDGTIDVVVGCVGGSSTKFGKPSGSIVGSIPRSASNPFTPFDQYWPSFWLLRSNYSGNNQSGGDISYYIMRSYGTYYIPTSHIRVTGKDIPQKWVAGRITASGSGSTPGKPNFNAWSYDYDVSGTQNLLVSGGFYSIQSSNVPQVSNSLIVYETNKDRQWIKRYVYNLANMFSWTPTPDYYSSFASVAQLTPTAADSTASTGVYAGTATGTLFNIPNNTINSSYEAILIAGKFPVAAILQDWIFNQDDTFAQFVDLTTNGVFPVSKNSYTLNGVSKPTCWNASNLPYVVKAPETPVTPGFLRQNTTYEITYSLFNKRLNFETNVGDPYEFTETAVDNYSIRINKNSIPIVYTDVVGGITYGKSIPINEYSARIYYRQKGTFEWIPCGEVDLARYAFNLSDNTGATDADDKIYSTFCANPIALLPGGQPGGFNDYSAIPIDKYDCVVTWQGRAFWSSKKNLVFSMRDNVFAYPLRNSVACPSGEFRGITVHAFPGQAEQRGRLIVWGSDECYRATFTGDPIITPVQVSANTVGQYPLDGSDFIMERWTTNTAFSSRSAVVAEGELYYWGPKGIFRDNGTEFPERISINIEPDLFSLYDPTKVNEIFGKYFSSSREIFWFYNAVVSDYTKAIVYNVNTGGFYTADFNSKIDNVMDLSIEDTLDVQKRVVGKRTIAFGRAVTAGVGTNTICRPYFFDIKNRAGDLSEGIEVLIKSFTVTGNTITAVLDTGYDATLFNSVALGSLVTFHQADAYANTTAGTIPDFIGTLATKSPSVTITKPASVTLPASWTASNRKFYIPIWIAPLTQIPWRIKTQYWTPAGLLGWFRFLFTHLMLKVNLWPTTSSYTLDLGYRTPISSSAGTKTLTLADNSDGNAQIYSPMPGDAQRFEGQGIKYDMSGVHNGGEWVLQYLGVHAEPQEGDNLQTFEG